jgi:ubiquitin-protein ligase
MPELPIEIWKDRINNELSSLKDLTLIEKNSIVWHENSVELVIKIKAIGFVIKTEIEPFDLLPKASHQVFMKINRSFPYPGGIDFAWSSNIFHPNIHPVELANSKDPGTGYICLNVLKQWSRLSDLETTVRALQKLVENPNPDDPLKYDICLKSAKFFKKNPMDTLKERFDLDELEEDDGEILVIDE